MNAWWALILAGGLFLIACTNDDTDTDTDTPNSEGPCADGGWGALDDPDAALHVRTDGEADGDGSSDAPLASVQAAVLLTRQASPPSKTIFVGPGTYAENLELWTIEGSTSDDGIAVLGCGVDEVVLEASDSSASVVKISAVQDFTLADLTLKGGRRGVWIWQAATGAVNRLTVRESTRIGIVIDGDHTTVALVDVEVHDTAEDTGSLLGYGLSVQDADVTMVRGGVWGSTRLGIFVIGENGTALADFQDINVSGTLPDADGYLGRGIQLQYTVGGTLSGGSVTGNSDGGIFGLQTQYLRVDGVEISATASAAIPDAVGESSGDGIVVTAGDLNVNPSWMVAEVEGATISGSGRAGMVFDGVTVDSLAGNTLSANGFDVGGVSVILQGGAVSGGSVSDDIHELTTPLVVNETSIQGDSFID